MTKSWWWSGALIVVGVLVGGGGLFLVTRPPRGEPVVLLPAPTQAPITVYVSGAVNETGLYSLPARSRGNDAIQIAGGFSGEADTQALNLAKILEDGEQIIVPARSSPAEPGSGSRGGNLPVTLVYIKQPH